jgi:hypothetical protein
MTGQMLVPILLEAPTGKNREEWRGISHCAAFQVWAKTLVKVLDLELNVFI